MRGRKRQSVDASLLAKHGWWDDGVQKVVKKHSPIVGMRNVRENFLKMVRPFEEGIGEICTVIRPDVGEKDPDYPDATQRNFRKFARGMQAALDDLHAVDNPDGWAVKLCCTCKCPPSLMACEIKNRKRFFDKIRNRVDPVSIFVADACSQQPSNLLQRGALEHNLFVEFITVLNRVIGSSRIYDKARFARVALTSETRLALESIANRDRETYQRPPADEWNETHFGEAMQRVNQEFMATEFLNRRLLEDAFPEYIVPMRRGLLTYDDWVVEIWAKSGITLSSDVLRKAAKKLGLTENRDEISAYELPAEAEDEDELSVE